MNIVRLTTRIYPDRAGPARYAYLLPISISDNQHHVFTISCKPEKVKEKFKQINPNCQIYYLPIKTPGLGTDETLISFLGFLLKFGILTLKRVLKIHRNHRIDIIHCDNPSITGLIAVLLKKLLNIPFIYTHHGLDTHFVLNTKLELNLIYRYAAKHIIISREYKTYYEKNNIDTENLIWIPNGVELKKYFHVTNNQEKEKLINELGIASIVNSDDFIIIYVAYMNKDLKVWGMIDFLYGLRKFLDNLNEAEKKKIKILFLGDGKDKELIHNEIKNLELEQNAFLLGSRTGIEKFYAISDLCPLTSHMEGFPTVLLEATASKVCCMATDVGEIKEILDEEALVPVKDRDAISEKLTQIFNDIDFRNRITENSYKKIQSFDWSNVANTIKGVYKKIIKNKK